ncbi:hypothetical protein [Archangium lansingense]|uniref:Uncharacterized protein n=1 Tax=Archangium lansingense TaxID=2995310 RepID=A0ABT4AG84_9BACT|nr:hypothetical protein [Archangium lansinium]MCY1079899.1 hypothetical protein [Archangium lansinium]
MPTETPSPRVNTSYVLDQLRRGLETSLRHSDPAIRARAAEKVERWCSVLEGMARGALSVGSRTPVEGVPAWVTLDVAHGGFATGQLLAGGPLEPYEQERLASLPNPEGATTERSRLNAWFLRDDGQRELSAALHSGCYRVRVPEEGALLTVTWLLGRGESERALELLETLAPLADRLRFYPAPDARPFSPSAVVRVQTVRTTVEQLDSVQLRPQIAKMNETLRVWNPLYDRAVELFLETVRGELPHLAVEGGELVRRPDGQGRVEGGWPCQSWPEGWHERARQLLRDYEAERLNHTLCGKPEHPKANFARLRGFLEQCVADARSLTGRDVGSIRKILASYVTRHGAPGSEQLRRVRDEQARMAAQPTGNELAMQVADRLRALPGDEGLSTLEVVSAPVGGHPIPPHLLEKVERSLEAPIDQLVERGVIGSGEVLATVLPQITSQVGAAGIEDPDLRRLYTAIYAAFRRRRSLLLLDLQHQVRFDELPWVEAIRPFRKSDLGARALARQTLEQVSTLALTSFPQTLLPNKLIQELYALAKGADLKLPLVEELAADIFMGTFSMKYLDAARSAARLLEGTLYARYYDVPTELLLELDDREKRWGKDTSPGFAELCTERAGAKQAGWSVARNGTIIEQAQILTTHNLAVLFEALGLAATLRPALPHLAELCFQWLVRQQSMKIDHWKARLQMVKNTAYAWRQMLFFLSLVERFALQEFLDWAREHVEEQDEAFVRRFEPVMAGLEWVSAGKTFDASGRGGPMGRARRFLGWSDGRHWLLEG